LLLVDSIQQSISFLNSPALFWLRIIQLLESPFLLILLLFLFLQMLVLYIYVYISKNYDCRTMESWLIEYNIVYIRIYTQQPWKYMMCACAHTHLGKNWRNDNN
jgi:hypothetical protein